MRRAMTDPEMLQRLTARRAELDELEEQLAGQLEQVRIELGLSIVEC